MRRTLLKLLSICMCMAVLQPSQPTLALPTATSASTSNITTQYTAPTTPIFSSTEDALLQSQQSQQSPPPSVSSSSAIAKEIDPLACIFLAIFLLVLCTLLYIFKFKRYFLWSLGFSSSSSNSNDRHDISPTQTASMAELERDFKKKVVLYEASLKLMEQLRLDNHQWQTPMNLQFLPSDDMKFILKKGPRSFQMQVPVVDHGFFSKLKSVISQPTPPPTSTILSSLSSPSSSSSSSSSSPSSSASSNAQRNHPNHHHRGVSTSSSIASNIIDLDKTLPPTSSSSSVSPFISTFSINCNNNKTNNLNNHHLHSSHGVSVSISDRGKLVQFIPSSIPNPSTTASKSSIYSSFFPKSSSSNDPRLELFSPALSTTTITSNYPLFHTTTEDFYYYEVEILKLPSSSSASTSHTALSIGLCKSDAPYFQLPGWSRDSFGFNSDDGLIHADGLFGNEDTLFFEGGFGVGDVVGCGYRPQDGVVFYTIRKKGFSLPGVVNGGGAMFLGDVFVGRFGCFKAAIGCMQKTVAVGSSSRKKKNNTSASTTGGVEVGGGGVGGGGDRRGGIVSKFFSRFSPKVAPEVSPSLNNGSGGGISSSSSSSSSLSSSSSPVDTVCSGFGDNKHLTASEKETYGIMPSEYEISCNNMNNNNNNIIISSETQLVEADDDSVVIRVNFGTHDFAYFEANMGLNDPDPPPSLYSRKSPLRSQNRSPPIYSADESNSTTTTTTDVSVPSPGGLLQFDESVISIPPPLYFPSRQDSPGG